MPDCPRQDRIAQEGEGDARIVAQQSSTMEDRMTSLRVAILGSAVAITGACSDLVEPTSARFPSPAAASVVFSFPAESPGAPFYAISANGGFIPNDGTWAAIPFHRELSCVPPAANLLVPAIPTAFGCTLTVAGHEHWENGPGIDAAPRQTQAKGLGSVPILFAQWAEVQGVAADGVLTLSELLALSSAIAGTAGSYHETDVFGISGPLGAGRGMYKINARGTLSDGRSFRLTVNEVLGELQVVQITFE
jgi:hypothetical protein